MILTDTFIIEEATLITEGTKGGNPILRGVFGRCNEANNNKRIYTKQVLDREVGRLTEAMQERRLLGELDHPKHDSVKLSNVSHLITGLSMSGDKLIGECELLNTPAGKVAKALVEGGVKVGISSRGMGTLKNNQDGTTTVNEDYKLVTFDLVADPSTRGAFPELSESTEAYDVGEIVKDTLDKVAKERVFTTLLKEKLDTKVFNQKEIKLVPGGRYKGKKNPTPATPFDRHEERYGYNTGLPRVVKTRSYDDAEQVTEPAEVSETQFSFLRNRLAETAAERYEDTPYSFLRTRLENQLQETKVGEGEGRTIRAAKKAATALVPQGERSLVPLNPQMPTRGGSGKSGRAKAVLRKIGTHVAAAGLGAALATSVGSRSAPPAATAATAATPPPATAPAGRAGYDYASPTKLPFFRRATGTGEGAHYYRGSAKYPHPTTATAGGTKKKP